MRWSLIHLPWEAIMKLRAHSRLKQTFRHDRVMPGHLYCLNCGLLDSDLSLSTLSIQHSNTHALITLSDHPSLLEIIFCAKKISWFRELPLFTSRNSKKSTSDSVWEVEAAAFATATQKLALTDSVARLGLGSTS